MDPFLDIFTRMLIAVVSTLIFVSEGNAQEAIDNCRENVYFESKDNYFVTYNECLEQPTKILYTIFPNRTPIVTRRVDGGRFFKIDYLHTSDNYDYRNNRYDRGHLLPASARRFDRRKYRQTFSFANVALQVDRLNRGIWRDLEVEVQELADSLNKEIDVSIEVLFSENSPRLRTGAVVPDGFKKIYLDECFYFKNTSNSVKEPCNN